jgi:hypothetical protein
MDGRLALFIYQETGLSKFRNYFLYGSPQMIWAE